MNREVLVLSLKALLPFRGMYIFWLVMMGFIYFSTAMAYGPQVHILMYFILLYFFAYICGSLLVDIQVKPVVFLLPGRERTLPWIILGAAALYGVLCGIPLLVAGPDRVLSGTGLSLPDLYVLGMALFQVMVMVCFRLRTSFLMFALFICLFILGPNPYMISTFHDLMSGAQGAGVWPYAVLAACTVFTFRMPRQEGFRRHNCGKMVMTFADMGNPNRVIRYFGKLKQQDWQREASEVERPVYKAPLGSRLGGRSNPDLSGFLDEIELFGHRVNWKFALLNIVLFSVVIAVSNGLVFRGRAPALILLFPLFIIYEQLNAFFYRRFSPMLPISRNRFFRLNLYKGALVYVATLVFILALLLAMRVLHQALPATVAELVSPFAQMPFKAAFYFGLAAPVFSWIFLVIRGIKSYLVLVMIFGIGSMLLTLFLFDAFLQLSPALVALITGLFALPYILQSHIRCFRADLIRF